MIINILAWIALVLLFVKTLVSFINWLSNLHLSEEYPGDDFKISVLIPARNEEENLPWLLDDLTRQNYQNFEVLVYDDHSTDKTPEIIDSFAQKDSRISLLPPKDLPREWLGKTFACDQLGRAANGEYLLFLDSDVRASEDLLRKALFCLRKHKLALLSIFPHQIMKSTGERLTVPLMNWILVSLLPMILIRKSKRPSLSAANGQFMFFDQKIYRQHFWHEQVRDNLVEDIEICRKMKSEGYQVATLLGKNDIKCRMYKNYADGLNGFAKNVVEFFGGSVWVTFLYGLITIFGILFIFINWGWQMLLIFSGMVILNRLFVSLSSKQPVLSNLFLHIPQMITFVIIVFKGIRVKLTKKYVWKGRETGGKKR